MTKYFCNVCGVEVKEQGGRGFDAAVVMPSAEGPPVKVLLRVRGTVGDTTESALCRYCLTDAVKLSDDRAPAPVKPPSDGA